MERTTRTPVELLQFNLRSTISGYRLRLCSFVVSSLFLG